MKKKKPMESYWGYNLTMAFNIITELIISVENYVREFRDEVLNY